MQTLVEKIDAAMSTGFDGCREDVHLYLEELLPEREAEGDYQKVLELLHAARNDIDTMIALTEELV